MTKNLPDLITALKEETEGSGELALQINEYSLLLSLDLKRGIEGYEQVTITSSPKNSPLSLADDFLIQYTGYSGMAFKTFLGQDYGDTIHKSDILRGWRRKVREMKRQGDFEIRGESGGITYARLVNLHADNTAREETEYLLYFFAETFKDKSPQYQICQLNSP